MNKQGINRRDFIKYVSGWVMGIAVLPLNRIFLPSGKSKDAKANLKEARHYTRADHLAG